MMRSALLSIAACTLTWAQAWAAPMGYIDGVPIEDSHLIEGLPVVLNGAAPRLRVKSKTAVTAVYLSERRDSMLGIEAIAGPKRIQLTMLRDIQGSSLSRYFIADFKAIASQEEFKQLINELSFVGSTYGSVHQVSKGDVINIDWVPGKGMVSTLNGKPLKVDGTQAYLNNEAMYRVMLRIYVAGSGTAESYDNLLGTSHSLLQAAGANSAKR